MGGPGGLRPEKPTSGISGVAIAIIVAAVLLAAIIYFMPRAPKATPPSTGAEVPAQPTGGQIQIQDVSMSRAPVGDSMYLQGRLNNAGQTAINGAVMEVVFRGGDGRVVGSERSKVMGLNQQGNTFTEQDLTQAPIKPNDTRPFRVTVNRVPQGWNQQTPELRVIEVTSHP